jgi:parvulin-like peptidyl-prolyl isomerase
MHKLILSIGLSALLLALNVNAQGNDPTAKQNTNFAQINDLTISVSEFQAIFEAAVRQKYYHGQVPAAELAAHDEALRQGLLPDRQKIDEDIDAFILKNAANPELRAQREAMVPRLVGTLERRDLLEQMEAKIKNLPAPGDAQVRQYYLDHPEKFTEPRRLRLSVILLKVPPYVPEDTWVAAETVAEELKQRIEAGEDFTALAKEYSDHPSAANGGDLGYLHQGVLEPEVQKKLETLTINQLSDPLRVLQGITLFQLNGVQVAQLKSFDEVKSRAAGLLYREIQDDTWQSYVKNLRSTANIAVHE